MQNNEVYLRDGIYRRIMQEVKGSVEYEFRAIKDQRWKKHTVQRPYWDLWVSEAELVKPEQPK